MLHGPYPEVLPQFLAAKLWLPHRTQWHPQQCCLPQFRCHTQGAAGIRWVQDHGRGWQIPRAPSTCPSRGPGLLTGNPTALLVALQMLGGNHPHTHPTPMCAPQVNCLHFHSENGTLNTYGLRLHWASLSPPAHVPQDTGPHPIFCRASPHRLHKGVPDTCLPVHRLDEGIPSAGAPGAL